MTMMVIIVIVNVVMMIVGGVGGDDVTIVCQWRHCCTFSCFWWAFVFTFISALSQIYFSFSQFFPKKGKAFWKWCHDMRKWLQIDFLHRSDFSLVKLCDFGSVRPAGDIVIKKVFHCFPPHIWIVSSRSINAMQSLQKNLSIFGMFIGHSPSCRSITYFRAIASLPIATSSFTFSVLVPSSFL